MRTICVVGKDRNMGRKKKEKKPLTEEEKEKLKAYKREYMKKYYQLNKERMQANALNRYYRVAYGLNAKPYDEPIVSETTRKWNKQLQKRLEEEPLTPMVRMWLLSQLNTNNQIMDEETRL